MRGDSGFRYHNGLEKRFPATLIDGHLVHVFEDGGEWHVWLNTEDMEFTGLCIGVGPTKDAALAQAVKALEAVTDFLQGVKC